MYSRAIEIYGDKATYTAQVARTYFKMAQLQSSLQLDDEDDEAVECL